MKCFLFQLFAACIYFLRLKKKYLRLYNLKLVELKFKNLSIVWQTTFFREQFGAGILVQACLLHGYLMARNQRIFDAIFRFFFFLLTSRI